MGKFSIDMMKDSCCIAKTLWISGCGGLKTALDCERNPISFFFLDPNQRPKQSSEKDVYSLDPFQQVQSHANSTDSSSIHQYQSGINPVVVHLVQSLVQVAEMSRSAPQVPVQ